MKKTMQTIVLLCLPLVVAADESMWTIDNFPSARVAEKYGIEIIECNAADCVPSGPGDARRCH